MNVCILHFKGEYVLEASTVSRATSIITSRGTA